MGLRSGKYSSGHGQGSEAGRAISSGGYSRHAAETFYVTGVPTQLHVLHMVGSLFYLLFTARAFRVIFYLILRSKKKKKNIRWLGQDRY